VTQWNDSRTRLRPSLNRAGVVQAAVDSYGSLDVLVNNTAVFGAGANAVDIPEDVWDMTMRVNVKGPFLCSQAATGRMREQEGGGSIVFVCSVSGVLANEHQADYNASKYGVIGLARCIASIVAMGGSGPTPFARLACRAPR